MDAWQENAFKILKTGKCLAVITSLHDVLLMYQNEHYFTLLVNLRNDVFGHNTQ